MKPVLKELLIDLKIWLKIVWAFLLAVAMAIFVSLLISLTDQNIDDSEKKYIGNGYYYQVETSGWVTDTAVRQINVFKERGNWLDKRIADVSMYYNDNGETVDVSIENNKLKIWINKNLKVEEIMGDEIIKLYPDQRWNE